MPSQLDNMATLDFAIGMPEVKQTVIRRIGGESARTEEVEAVVELDGNLGLVDAANSQYHDFAGLMDIPADQANSMHDTWVIDGEVYVQQGEAVGKDGATKTVQLIIRKGIKARSPRLSGR